MDISEIKIDFFIYTIAIILLISLLGITIGFFFSANTDGTPGAIGFVSRIIPRVYPIAIIKVDQETGEPIRDQKGLCQVTAHTHKLFIRVNLAFIFLILS